VEFPTIVYCQNESKKKPEHVIIVLKLDQTTLICKPDRWLSMMQKGTDKAYRKIKAILKADINFNGMIKTQCRKKNHDCLWEQLFSRFHIHSNSQKKTNKPAKNLTE